MSRQALQAAKVLFSMSRKMREILDFQVGSCDGWATVQALGRRGLLDYSSIDRGTHLGYGNNGGDLGLTETVYNLSPLGEQVARLLGK